MTETIKWLTNTAPVYAGANFFLKNIFVNIKNPFKKMLKRADIISLCEKGGDPL